ncbi:hypothetical protein CLS_39170 [[Clostridium] cf. saccharolyticum K10]|nr:hypothetical protein CLS_39170 [[Clostridium] cf. saccharolyticum K10]
MRKDSGKEDGESGQKRQWGSGLRREMRKALWG